MTFQIICFRYDTVRRYNIQLQLSIIKVKLIQLFPTWTFYFDESISCYKKSSFQNKPIRYTMCFHRLWLFECTNKWKDKRNLQCIYKDNAYRMMGHVFQRIIHIKCNSYLTHCNTRCPTVTTLVFTKQIAVINKPNVKILCTYLCTKDVSLFIPDLVVPLVFLVCSLTPLKKRE